jgi:class 3 adenylate cyclase
MSTILRIGSLMKVGFGSAGVEIIRNNLETGQNKNMLIMNSQGSTVSCIFLFCDIRQFTDATECLQEEVFVFTNRIAGVVHSICHSYGGSANKNIGDAFLLSWLLDDGPANDKSSRGLMGYEDPSHASAEDFSANHNQADKALLSVVKIAIALHHDKYYLDPLSDAAKEALLAKVSKRKGPVVQLGFGLHAGKAVQGAIGSQRKIDATYVSEAVERAEFLESSTKKYGLKMLMSDSFHRLLHPSNRRRCRKIDQIRVQTEDYAEYQDIDQGDIMDLFTFDMDIDALWRPPPKPATMTPTTGAGDDNASETGSQNEQKGSRREISRAHSVRGPGGLLKVPALQRRRSIGRLKTGGNKDDSSSEEFKSVELTTAEAAMAAVAAVVTGAPNAAQVSNPSNRDATEEAVFTPPELVLPTGPALYNANVWLSEDMRKIRQLYSDGLFFQKFNSGFLSYYARDWEHAKQCFQTILERFDDGPSSYFLKKIKETDGVPPRDFKGYGSS